MEEKKKDAKQVKLNAKPQAPIQGKLSYEQLNEACIKLSQQVQYYENRIKAQQNEIKGLVDMFTRLDYLFKVVENADKFRDPDFINMCLEEIKFFITPRKEEPQGNPKGQPETEQKEK